MLFLKAELRAVEKGYIVSKPTIDTRYDMIIDDKECLYRVQVKYADGMSSSSEGCVLVDLRRRNGNDTLNSRTYLETEIDSVVVYIPRIDRLCWFPPEKFHDKVQIFIRLEPPKNNIKCVTMAQDYYW